MVVCLIIVSLQVLSFENLTLNFELLSSDLDLDHGLDNGLETKLFYDVSQSAAPSKHHISYGKSFKKFNGGVVGWGGLFDYSVSPGPFF